MKNLLEYANKEIVRLKLEDSETNCHGVVASIENDGIRLSDGVGLNVICHTKDEIDSELEEMADFYENN